MARDNVELLPDGTDLDNESSTDFSDDEFGAIDLTQLTVNFSQQEAESEARTFEAVPTGKYYCRITDVDVKRSKSEKHAGKPYYALELVIQDGKYANRKLWTNVMLFEGALYSLAQLHKALDFPMTGGVIQPSQLQSRELVVIVQRVTDSYKIKQEQWTPGDGPKPMKAEVRGFQKYIPGVTGTSSAAAQGVEKSGSGSLLP
jgi:hypothetical protein